MPSPSTKAAALAFVIACVQKDVDDTARAAADARAAATHEEAKPENDKDTRGLEQSYLAAGQAARVAELQRSMGALRGVVLNEPSVTVEVGAVVTLRDTDADTLSHIMVLPAGAGVTVDIDDVGVMVVTPQAPLARAIMGKRVDDEVEVKLGGKVRQFEIEAIR
jgi:transcription elongation GreA/GreB family factor